MPVTQILVDLSPDIAEKLELRAKRLGSSLQREASRLIRERLDAEPSQPPDAGIAGEAELDPRFVRDHGFLVFTGEVPPDAIPDHRAIQDERILALVNDAGARRV